MSQRGPSANWRTHLRVLAIATCVLVGSLITTPLSANATVYPCAGASYNFDGLYTDNNPQTSIEGAGADIRVEGGFLCSGSSGYDITTAWSMIAEGGNHRANGVRGLAQVGFIQNFQHNSPNFFYEDAPNDAGSEVYWHGAQSVGVTHHFWVQWIKSPCAAGLVGCLSMNVDSTRLATSSFNPYTPWGDPRSGGVAWDMQFLGETHDTSTDMPGLNNGNTTVYSNAQAQNANTDVFGTFPCVLGQPTLYPRYGISGASGRGCTNWNIYTK